MEKTPNWMNYVPMLRFYKQLQKTEGGLKPDSEFLSDPSLGRYLEYHLKELALPKNIKSFLMQVGLPDQFSEWRSPDEETEAGKNAHVGIVFGISCLDVKEFKGKKYLIIGENRSLSRTCVIANAGKPDEIKQWEKSESCSLIAVELETGEVWKWILGFSRTDEDIFIFVNSSLEQYLLSMACWRSFYLGFAQKVREFTEENPENTELDFIFDHDELYEPFLNTMELLDPTAVENEFSYWPFMCDLSLY
jgi:hypothetical protein